MAGIFGKRTVAAKAAKKPENPFKKAVKKGNSKVTPEERFKMIEQAAYFRAEKAGFTGGSHEHWAAAEKEVDRLLAKRR